MTGTILLTGGWGKTASRIAKLLSAKGIPVQIASRKGAAAIPSEYKSQYSSLTGAIFDWTDPSTHANPFNATNLVAPISAVYLVPPAVPDIIGAMKPFIDLAIEQGVKRFVLMSGAGVDKGGWGYGKVHEYLADGGHKVEYCVLRPPWFYANMLSVASISEEDIIVSATGDGKFPMTSEDDIAEAAVGPLIDEKVLNNDIFIMGPELLTFDLVAEKLTKVLGRKITHVKVTTAEFTELLLKQGIPEAYAPLLAGVDAMKAAGSDEKLFYSPGKVVGRVFIEEFLGENKSVFAKADKPWEGPLLGTRFKGLEL
ncbi:hypothetical protein BDZ94DRAFT_1326684 [Collybia nuda]|uniref:NmrA-like domain-containing protein n=1 Tax=Collybia nuda TaxID=64659 RepID=A0A9P5XSM2_9AGAR|nr:hypothetical protein BDZ94DRAFT_1326684 [Collybia nuda]